MDLISRQAAIDTVESFDILDGYTDQQELIRRIRQLPPAQPELSDVVYQLWKRAYEAGERSAQYEVIKCKDCRHRGEKPIADGRYWCDIHDAFMYYCSDAERRTDDQSK